MIVLNNIPKPDDDAINEVPRITFSRCDPFIEK